MNKIKRFFLFFFVSLFLIFFDQWTKHLAVAFLKGGAEIVLLPRVLYLLYVENPGAAFGILRGQQFFLEDSVFLPQRTSRDGEKQELLPFVLGALLRVFRRNRKLYRPTAPSLCGGFYLFQPY